jgi:acyl-CoA dehydrogenase
MSTERQMLSESVGRLLAEQAPTDAVRDAEGVGWLPELWQLVSDSGLDRIAIPEEHGGGGGSLADAHAVLWQVGRNASPIPIAETGLLGGWALSEAGLPLPAGPITVVPDSSGAAVRCTKDGDAWRLQGTGQLVPWASHSERIVVIADAGEQRIVLSVPTTEVTCGGELTLAGEPRETVSFDDVVVDADSWAEAPESVTHDSLLLRGALTRVTMMGGAMERAAEMGERYANERHQFGRPIAKFQAVQHHLVAVREEANRTAMAGNAALLAVEQGRPGSEFDVAAAKVVAGDSTRVLAARSHQLHGAIGVTFEYDLHLFTRRLHAWRDEYGSARYFAQRVARIVAEHGPDQLWPLITRSVAR